MTVFVYRHCEWLLALWIFFIFLLCSAPGHFIPSADWMDLLSVDKLVHAGLFFVLCGLFFLLVFKRQHARAFMLLYTLAAVLYGISLEYMQALWFSNRSFDYLDMLANTFGCALALSVNKTLLKRFKPAGE